jgi:hypothetical protein
LSIKVVAMTDIISLIKEAGTQIAKFSIGFAKFGVNGGEEDVVPAGSGALVSVGSIHGILTAAHVLDELPHHGKVGLIRFTTNPVVQKLAIEMSLTERLAIRGHAGEADGPDLGFLRLSSIQVATLNAMTPTVFFNLTNREESVLSNNHPSDEYFEAVCGIIGEWTTEHAVEAGFDRLRGFRGLFGVGCVTATRECNGYDLVDFETKREENSRAPWSYQGWSGGALWRVYIAKDSHGQPSLSDERIWGVAFHQSDLIDGVRTITCHGPKSVYAILINEIRSKWPVTGS